MDRSSGRSLPDSPDGYSYRCLERDLLRLRQRYPRLEQGSLGRSVLGRPLHYLRLGTGPHEFFYNAAHHANEWITSPVLMRFAADLAAAYSAGEMIDGYPAAALWERSSIYLLPMVNPDGVELVLGNENPECYEIPARVIRELAGTGTPLARVWKANIRGVDLNLNYPAGWEEAKRIEREQGITGPAAHDYGGPAPLSEPETGAVAAFTCQHDFRLVLAFHTQGRVIYWRYLDEYPPGAWEIAQVLAAVSGYGLEANPPDASYAGYKDWFIHDFDRPGFTVEVGMGVNPLPASDLEEIYRENLPLMVRAALV
jgi:g-D-glutamyl-meso-diaminopimelate peptidase